MTLIQVKLGKDLEFRNSELTNIHEQQAQLKVREVELELQVRAIETEEESRIVGEHIAKLEDDRRNLDEERTRVENEIDMIERKLDDISGENGPEAKDREENLVLGKNTQERGATQMTQLQTRNVMATNYYQERSVTEFYDNLKNIRTRSVTGEGLTIPQVILDRIMVKVGDYANIYPLVDKIAVKGTARILLDVSEAEAGWLEMTSAFTYGNAGTIENVDFLGFKVGRLITIDNSFLQDSIVNLDNYVVEKIAWSIAKALDKAILNGTGAATFQPDGIIPKLSATHKVAVTLLNDDKDIARLVAPLGLVDNGTQDVDSVVCVMNRVTYYNRILAMNMGEDDIKSPFAKLPVLTRPTILGLPVVFSAYMAEDDVLFGDFSKYTMVNREDITIDRSEHARFAEDQLAIRGKGRFDGKPTRPDAFVLVTMS